MPGEWMCHRCGGLQLQAHFANEAGAVHLWGYDGWRCMNCGDVIDTVILENRRLQHKTIAAAPVAGDSQESGILWLKWPRTGGADSGRSAPRTRHRVDLAVRRRQAVG